jgi:hypothetical protein
MTAQVRLTDKVIHSIANGTSAVRFQRDILLAYMRGRLIMRLGLYVLATVFVAVAAFLIVFAPNGKETASTIVAISLLAVALGAAGFGTFAIKAPLVSVEAENEDADLDRPVTHRVTP